jgi:hypothetical protein
MDAVPLDHVPFVLHSAAADAIPSTDSKTISATIFVLEN